VNRGDGGDVAGLLAAGGPVEALQLAGDGLLAALAQHVDGAAPLARSCAALLRDRDWYGDAELAEQIDAALGDGPVPALRALAVDLGELASILEGDPLHAGGRIDLETGEVWHRAAIDYAVETGEEDPEDVEDERWLYVHPEGSRDGYRDMVLFIQTVTDAERADRLDIATSGRGAFRRFKDVLARWPGELDRWYALSEERQRGRARWWLAGEGLRPAVPSAPKPWP
jgi:hypothetical protein